jgi:hypothetical protein
MSKKLTLEQKIQRLKDIEEVQRVMSRYEYFHLADLREEMIGLFAQRRDTSSGNNMTVSVGFENVRAFMRSVGGGTPKPGSLNIHALTTPAIEVARDGHTAQGLWIAPGAETVVEEGKPPSAYWTMIRIGTDFIKEGQQWKIWHYHRFDIFTVAYGDSWAKVSSGAGGAPTTNTPLPGTRPSAYHWAYSPTVAVENIPPPPQPYETWDDSRSYARYQLSAGKQE